jgi:hypothetical protein
MSINKPPTSYRVVDFPVERRGMAAFQELKQLLPGDIWAGLDFTYAGASIPENW